MSNVHESGVAPVDNSFAAVDLGASSGRVLHGTVTTDRIEVRQVHRFVNEPVHLPGGMHWDITGLYRQICAGLRAAGPVRSAGIDSWAVDYGLLDGDGRLLGLPHHYRDPRTSWLDPSPVDQRELFRRTGVADQPFNTVHQLRSEPELRLATAVHMLLVPDLLGYWLTGRMGTERTNASTTGLYSAVERDWDYALIRRMGLPHRIFETISNSGTGVGTVRASVRAMLGHDLSIMRVASHDTASAVAAIPTESSAFAYISCGTWSLVGVERPTPLLSGPAHTAGFTNETGVCGFRYLRNVMGLWLLQECQREWPGSETAALIAQAAQVPACRTLIDVDDPVYLAPGAGHAGTMTARIAANCAGPRPAIPAEFVRCILDSLALGHARAVADALRTSGRTVEIVHLVGGGARNELLCQLTADACGLPVAAGPVEATALGNLLAQAVGAGVVPNWRAARRLLAATQPPVRYQPRDGAAWQLAAERVAALRGMRAA
ncbi:rhamnulokinase [Nocardia neocaledoniensis]|uniref:rhamnulokinase n=1 Tax=Nocardia neocaledoniensis TaxID=236511 RepID=UPI002456A241|nr:rhamnulokinase family protein [Nocardia neocaledoniensis]